MMIPFKFRQLLWELWLEGVAGLATYTRVLNLSSDYNPGSSDSPFSLYKLCWHMRLGHLSFHTLKSMSDVLSFSNKSHYIYLWYLSISQIETFIFLSFRFNCCWGVTYVVLSVYVPLRDIVTSSPLWMITLGLSRPSWWT